MNIRPSGPTSMGSKSTEPPFSLTAAAVLSASSLAMYSVHTPRSPLLIGGLIPATLAPLILAIE